MTAVLAQENVAVPDGQYSEINTNGGYSLYGNDVTSPISMLVGQSLESKTDDFDQLLMDSSFQTNFLSGLDGTSPLGTWPQTFFSSPSQTFLSSDFLPESEILNLSLFCETDIGGFSNDSSPLSSMPSTPYSYEALSPEEQEVQDIVSSFQDNSYSNYIVVDPSPSSSPLKAEFTSDSVPSPSQEIMKRKHEEDEQDLTPSTKRSRRCKLSTNQRKERKKEQNKTAALRYRQRKKEELQVVEEQEQALEEKNKNLKSRVQSLESEIQYLKHLWTEISLAKQNKQLS